MGKIKPMQVGYLYTNEKKNNGQRNEWVLYVGRNDHSEMKDKQIAAAESGEG